MTADEEIACRRPLTGRGAEYPVLDHYLEALLTEPGARERSDVMVSRGGGCRCASLAGDEDRVRPCEEKASATLSASNS
ncbi:hypothetical protein ACWEWG_28175 [Streptomyces sp. NPDC003758]